MSRDIIVILGLTLVVVAAWISIDIHKAMTRTAAPVVTVGTLRPVDPDLDLKVLQDLKDRRGH